MLLKEVQLDCATAKLEKGPQIIKSISAGAESNISIGPAVETSKYQKVGSGADAGKGKSVLLKQP